MIEPLYSPTQGGPFGFRCKLCSRVVRTYRGVMMHAFRVHGLKPQMELFDKERTQDEANKVYNQHESIRDEQPASGARTDEHRTLLDTE